MSDAVKGSGRTTHRATRLVAGERGQAMTETLLLALPLMMIAAALLQIFLIDEYTFRIATRAHQRLFAEQAFPANRPNVGYDTPTVRWNDPPPYVPVVGFFAPYGLNANDLRIRSRARGGEKRMQIGRGTAPSISLGGLLDLSAANIDASAAMSGLERAKALRLEMEQRARSGR